MSDLLPPNFVIPEGTAFTLALANLGDVSVTIEEGEAFSIEGDLDGISIERDDNIVLVSGYEPRPQPRTTVIAKNRSIAAGGDIRMSNIVVGDSNTVVSVGRGSGNKINVGGGQAISITVPCPTALVIGDVRRVRIHLSKISILMFSDFKGDLVCHGIPWTIKGRYAASASVIYK